VLRTEFKKNGATVVYELVTRELYDMKEFDISDLDGDDVRLWAGLASRDLSP
jgi:hypothetical protein